jgi:hypothetical protein
MRNFLRTGAAAVALLTGVAAVDAQTVVRREIELSPAQRTVIYETVTRERPVVVTEPGVELRVGARLPRTVRVYDIPDRIVTEVPVVKQYRYVYVNDQVVLVDPDTSEVVEIIRR